MQDWPQQKITSPRWLYLSVGFLLWCKTRPCLGLWLVDWVSDDVRKMLGPTMATSFVPLLAATVLLGGSRKRLVVWQSSAHVWPISVRKSSLKKNRKNSEYKTKEVYVSTSNSTNWRLATERANWWLSLEKSEKQLEKNDRGKLK